MTRDPVTPKPHDPYDRGILGIPFLFPARGVFFPTTRECIFHTLYTFLLCMPEPLRVRVPQGRNPQSANVPTSKGTREGPNKRKFGASKSSYGEVWTESLWRIKRTEDNGERHDIPWEKDIMFSVKGLTVKDTWVRPFLDLDRDTRGRTPVKTQKRKDK